MRRFSLILIALSALLLGACQTSEDSGASTSAGPIFSTAASPSADASAATSADTSAGASPSGSPDESADASGSPDESADASGSPDESDGTGTGGGTGGGGCEDSFADVPDLGQLTSLSQLQEALDAIDATIEDCETVQEWTDAAETELNLEGLDTDAEDFLEARCEDSEQLTDAALCEELDS